MPEASSRTSRRAEIVRAAIRAFARGGFEGTTLADIAKEAGVSQPRISQIFGNKENAFVEAHQEASEQLTGMLRASATAPFSARKILDGYYDIVSRDPDAMMMCFRGFASAGVPRIGEDARRVFHEVIDMVVTRGGGSYADALDLLGRGFAIYHVLAADLPGHVDESEHFAGLLRELRNDGAGDEIPVTD